MSSPMEHISWGGTGQRTVGTSSVALVASATTAKRVLIKALNGNAGLVYVGSLSGVSSSTGYHIAADQETPWIDVPGNDLANVYLIASQASQGVSFTYDRC